MLVIWNSYKKWIIGGILLLIFGCIAIALVSAAIGRKSALAASTPAPTQVVANPTSSMVDVQCGENHFSLIPAPAGASYGCDAGQPIFVFAATPIISSTPIPQLPTATFAPAANAYPLSGQKYTAWINGSADTSGLYDPIWTASGWLWQPNLPPEGQRVGFVVSITIEEGVYTFNGVSCRLHLDTARNGLGANNPQTVGFGNNLQFTVDTADGGQAWAFVVCDPTDVTGFSVQYERPLP